MECLRKITRGISPSTRGGSRGHTTAVVQSLEVVLLTILIQVSGSVIQFGMQSIYRALISLRRPLHGSSATSWGQIVLEIFFFSLVYHVLLGAVSRGVRNQRGLLCLFEDNFLKRWRSDLYLPGVLRPGVGVASASAGSTLSFTFMGSMGLCVFAFF